MNIKAFVLALAVLITAISLSAQENETREKIRYSNVTEFGFFAASPRGISFEGTTAHGFSVEKQHHFGLGTGIGFNLYKVTTTDPWSGMIHSSLNAVSYMPVFLNYRFYFKLNKTFSPHLNMALGGLVTDENMGIYSSITMGFKARAFSFSSGLSFMPFRKKEEFYNYYDIWGNRITDVKTETEWCYPFGLTLKFGFAF